MYTSSRLPGLVSITVIVALVACGTSPTTTPSETGTPDIMDASQEPPGGLAVSDVPMFVSIGSDDNMESDGVAWLSALSERKNPPGSGQPDTFDGEPVSLTFFHTSRYAGLAGDSWLEAYQAGHEVGNHTETHATSNTSTHEDWMWEMQECQRKLGNLGIASEHVQGFRTPFLGTNDDTLAAVAAMGFAYDCSLEEGFQTDQDGTNYFWPYTLDAGSPGNDLLSQWSVKAPVSAHPGLWELPVYALIVPPDDQCEAYGVAPGLRDRLKAKQDYFEVDSGKITGFDYNLLHADAFGMTGPEYEATLRYSFDLRLAGNRAPFMLGAHAINYVDASPEYRAAIDGFLDHVLAHPDVRVVSMAQILTWLRNPVALGRGR